MEFAAILLMQVLNLKAFLASVYTGITTEIIVHVDCSGLVLMFFKCWIISCQLFLQTWEALRNAQDTQQM